MKTDHKRSGRRMSSFKVKADERVNERERERELWIRRQEDN
jgi:hypothetical protein